MLIALSKKLSDDTPRVAIYNSGGERLRENLEVVLRREERREEEEVRRAEQRAFEETVERNNAC